MRAVRGVKLAFLLLAFAVPLVLLWVAQAGDGRAWLLAAPIQYVGLGRRALVLLRAGAPSAEPVLPGGVLRST